MNTKTLIIGLLALVGFVFCYQKITSAPLDLNVQTSEASILSSPVALSSTPEAAPAAAITWMTWDEAVAATKENPKHMIVDVYTDWCGWCKRMDATTFKDPKVAAYISENFYAVKFDAEQREPIEYDGNTFTFQRSGKRGVHQLAAVLLDNRLSYPSVVYFTGNMERIMISPGYKDADSMLKELKMANGEGM